MKIAVYQGRDRQWYLRLVARNGEIVLDSEGYSTKSNAKRAAKRLQFLFSVPLVVRVVEER